MAMFNEQKTIWDEAPRGLQWALPAGQERASTTAAGKRVFAAAAAALGEDALAGRITEEADWRHKYAGHVCELSERSVAASAADALASAHAALRATRAEMVYFGAGASEPATVEAAVAAALAAPGAYETKTIAGAGTAEAAPGLDKDVMTTVKNWVEYGSCEPDVQASLDSLGGVLPLPKDTVFVVLGATSELGPARTLLSLGLTVAGVCRASSKLAELVAFAAASPGTLLLPRRAKVAVATGPAAASYAASGGYGADLLTDFPDVAKWLTTLAPGPMVLGCYVYLDGEKHVRASVAMDAVVTAVSAERGPASVALANLGSPATAHIVPIAARNAAAEAWEDRPWVHKVGGFKSSAREPVTAGGATLVDGIAVFQGPNYALAKYGQMYRALVMRCDAHAAQTVSVNMAPMARTVSVMHSPKAAAALEGLCAFAPLVAGEPGLVSRLMAYLLLFDLASDASPANPKNALAHPWDLFASNGVHGGTWRCPFTLESLGTASFVMGKIGYRIGGYVENREFA